MLKSSISESTLRVLEPFLSKEKLVKLHYTVKGLIEDDKINETDPGITAEMVLTLCMDELRKGWQEKQKTYEDHNKSGKFEVSCRVHDESPGVCLIALACRGPKSQLHTVMQSECIQAIKNAIRKSTQDKSE